MQHGEALREDMNHIEAWLIRRALEQHGGRRTATERKLGITREGLASAASVIVNPPDLRRIFGGGGFGGRPRGP